MINRKLTKLARNIIVMAVKSYDMKSAQRGQTGHWLKECVHDSSAKADR